jgi:hypothetical protein
VLVRRQEHLQEPLFRQEAGVVLKHNTSLELELAAIGMAPGATESWISGYNSGRFLPSFFLVE